MMLESIPNGIKSTVEEKENHTLEDLQQKLINDLYNYENINKLDDCFGAIELLKVILENSKISSKNTFNNDGMTTEVGNSQFKVNEDSVLISSSDVTIQHTDGTREQVPNTYSYKFKTKKDVKCLGDSIKKYLNKKKKD